MIPNLRFRQFAEPWRPVTLGETSHSVSYGLNSAATKYDGNVKYIRITDIDDETNKFVPSPLTSPAGHVPTEYLLKHGDILFARTGASVGKAYCYSRLDGNLAFAGFLIRFRIDETEYVPEFVFLNTVSQSYRKWVKVHSVRSGQPGVNAEEYKSYSFFAPGQLEQQKIADFLTSVDTRIQQLKQKQSLLQQYKKGLMQQLFSQTLRFKDDAGHSFPDWEEVRLGDAVEVNPKAKSLPSEFFYIDLESVNDGTLGATKHISKEGAPSRAQRMLSPSDILYQTVRPYQKNNLFFSLEGQYVASTGYAQLRAAQNVPEYIYQYLHLDSFVSLVLNRCTGTSYPAINSSDLADIAIKLPCIEEQTKIANSLGAMDKKIDAVGQQIEHTKTFKKGLLQQMFV